jgi:vacuolar protein sorting-associated protein 35
MLAEHLESVRQQAALLKKSVDSNNYKEAVRHAAQLLGELRTGWLSPKTYYELYLEVFSHLSFLEVYFMQLQRGGMAMSELFVHVQHAGTVLVRLYLLITAGSAYLKSGQIGARELLTDLMEMVKGVQQPQRALFLRYYLHQKFKDKLPDVGTVYEGAGGSVRDAVDVVIRNFSEMNRLWVRMQVSLRFPVSTVFVYFGPLRMPVLIRVQALR